MPSTKILRSTGNSYDHSKIEEEQSFRTAPVNTQARSRKFHRGSRVHSTQHSTWHSASWFGVVPNYLKRALWRTRALHEYPYFPLCCISVLPSAVNINLVCVILNFVLRSSTCTAQLSPAVFCTRTSIWYSNRQQYITLPS